MRSSDPFSRVIEALTQAGPISGSQVTGTACIPADPATGDLEDSRAGRLAGVVLSRVVQCSSAFAGTVLLLSALVS